MTMDRLLNLVKVFVSGMDIPANAVIEPDTNFTYLGFDSLDRMELVMEVEDEFGIMIPDDDSDTFTTVRSVAEYLVKVGEVP